MRAAMGQSPDRVRRCSDRRCLQRIMVTPGRGRSVRRGKYNTMLKWALIFFVISLIAGIFGFSGVSAATAGIAKILFFIAIIIFAIFILLALFAGQAIL